jgi:hypothetical protein
VVVNVVQKIAHDLLCISLKRKELFAVDATARMDIPMSVMPVERVQFENVEAVPGFLTAMV